MNKKVFVLFVLMAAPVVASAQLKVKSNGYVVAGTELQTSSYFNIAFQSGIQTSNYDNNVAVYGKAKNGSSTGAAYGFYGVADNSLGFRNFGVYGTLDNNSYGVGVYGGTFVQGGIGFSNKYAGYFWGNTNVDGTLTATSVVQTSDLRLKENIIPLSSRSGSVLDKLLDMNVIEFSYKNIKPGLILPDSVSLEELQDKIGEKRGKKHIGLIAQELQEQFPTLVEEGADGYLAVNYIELVPVLLRAIQELKAELDEVKGTDNGRTRSAADDKEGFSAASKINVLYQNNPNPFKEQTVIRFKLADDVQDASICIFDMTGKTIKKLPISSGMESVSIGGYELGEGMFLYSLIVNGQEIDTKRMIISK